MSIIIESSTTPADLLSPSDAMKIAGISTAEWSHARKYRPEDFPKNYGTGFSRSQRFSAVEVTAFFNKYNKKGD
ncbi:Uncharacterised protein [Salmonella enterica]|nr:Uncharacterised protein [Salmonella enterica]